MFATSLGELWPTYELHSCEVDELSQTKLLDMHTTIYAKHLNSIET